MNSLQYYDLREKMCHIAREMWERRLTNSAGGNFAVRADENRVLISPSMMSEHKQCILRPHEILLIDYGQNLLDGEGELSRETKMHLLILENFKNIGCTIHAHPFWCMAFVSQGRPIPGVTEATMGRGGVGCIEYTKAYSPELAQNVYNYFEARRELAERKPIGVILPLHGVVVSGPNLYGAYSMLERIECDAFCNITKEIVRRVSPDSVLG
jgi:L-fuculose-phosphate aldolase